MRSPHGTEQGRLAARQGEELGEVLVARPSLLLADTVELRNKLRYLTRYRVDPVRCELALDLIPALYEKAQVPE